MDTKLLQEIVYNTSPKESHIIVMSGKNSELKTKMTPPLILNKSKNYEIALLNLETYYSFPNVTKYNNQLSYSTDKGETWNSIVIPEGCYELNAINRFVKDQLDDENFITIVPNVNTLKSILKLGENIQVDFTHKNSINKLLGFNSQVYSKTYQESENIVNIMHISSIFVNCSIVQGERVNGELKPVIFSFFPNVSPGYKIIINPKNLIYIPVTLKKINDITVILTDQDGNPLNLRGEGLVIRLHLRST